MKHRKVIAPKWKDYELLDCGNGRKLERFGTYVLDRPEVAATGKPAWSANKWKSLTDSKFKQSSANSGKWSRQLPDWQISYDRTEPLTFHLQLNQFKHVGVFPEQSANWEWMSRVLHRGKEPLKALNLFAYTGGASLMAKALGADITHVEAISQLIARAKSNMDSTGLKDIRWMKEDALKFAQKEVKRGKKYDLIIMDPPTWGRGPKGEIWKIEKHLSPLIDAAAELLSSGGSLILNTYSGISPLELKAIIEEKMNFKKLEAVHLNVLAKSGKEFTTGSLLRGTLK